MGGRFLAAVTLAILLLSGVAAASLTGKPPDFCSRHPGNPNCATTSTATTPSTSTTVPTTTTTPSTGWGTGIGIIKYGSASFSNVARYQVYNTGPNQQAQVASQPGPAHLYMCGVNIPDVDWSADCGVPISVARANGWILKDASGGEVKYQSCSDYSYLADVGSAGYQQEWIKDVIAIMQRYPGMEYVMIDNVIGNRIDGCTKNTKYTDNNQMRAAVLSFVRVVYPALHAAGYKVSVNHDMNDCFQPTGAWPCGGDQCDGTQIMWWEQQLAPYVDAFMQEHFQQINGVRHTLGTACNGFWDGNERIVGNIEGLGKDFLPVDSGNDSDGSATYTRASFLLETNRPTSAFSWACGGSGAYATACDPLISDGGVWAKPCGAPLGAKTIFANGVRKRSFTTCTVYVNPTLSTQTADGHTLSSGTAFIG